MFKEMVNVQVREGRSLKLVFSETKIIIDAFYKNEDYAYESRTESPEKRRPLL